jgi:hypothetical protein
LLPAPTVSAASADDALAQIMKMSSALGESTMRTQRGKVERTAVARKEAADKRLQALNEAVLAAKKAAEERSKGGLFDFITDNIGVAGLVGFVTGQPWLIAQDLLAHRTGLQDSKADLTDLGALIPALTESLGPLSTAVLMTGQQAVKKAAGDEFQRALDDVYAIEDQDVRVANKLALSLTMTKLTLAATVASGGTSGPALVSLVGTGISAAAQLSHETGLTKAIFKSDADAVTMGLTVAGAVLSLQGGIGSAVSATKGVATGVAAGVSVAQGALHAGDAVVRAYHAGVAAGYQRDADFKQIGAKSQEQLLDAFERLVDNLLDDVREAKQSADKTAQLVQSCMQTQQQTMMSTLLPRA